MGDSNGMTQNVSWRVTVDEVTDALVRSHLARQAARHTLDDFIVSAVRRELDRVAILEQERAEARPIQDQGVWEIVIPLPPRR